MSLITFWNKIIKKLDWSDIALIKISVAASILMVAKLWAPLLSLDWYWYGIIFVLTAIKPLYVAYIKKLIKMGLIQLINSGKKKFTVIDVASDEIAMFALAFLIAKYYTIVTSLAWYWYVIIFAVFVIKPVIAMLKN